MKQFKFITVGAMMAFLLAGCADDDLVKESVVLPVSGDEIEFGAAPGGFTDVDPTTRTIYDVPAGSTFDSYTLLNIKWQYDIDKVRVYCPEGAEGFRTADYTVVKETTDASSDTSTGFLLKNGETGVRWGDTKDTHNFYAFYSLDRIDEGLQTGTTVTATIPTGQEGGQLLTYNNDGTFVEDKTGPFKIITPDMTYCLMAGKGTWNPEDDKNVALTFSPIVTVLDVLINGPEEGSVNSMNIVSVSVRSKTGKNIVGTFSYNLADNTYNFDATDKSQDAASIATVQTVIDNNPVELKQGQQLNVKFFLLPREVPNGDLVVSVFTEGGVVYNKTVSRTNGTDDILSAGLITRIKTPKLGGQDANNWMSLIPNNALFTQLSLPGSKHAFSYNTAESFDPNTGISHYYQALPPLEIRSGETGTFKTTQFDEGVRVFDVHLNLTSNSRYATPIVYAGGANLDPEYTLSDVLTALNKKIHPNSKPVTECAVVFLNFVNGESAGGTASVSTWLSAVTNALNTWNDSHTDVLTTLSTDATMWSMRGKIAVIINLEKQVESSISATAPINYIIGLSTSVQNTNIVDATYNGSAGVRIQNLQQCNNPDITDPGEYGYRDDGIGLVPYFITKANYDNPSVSCNLLETKKALMEQINTEIVAGGKLFINDLSGFCVTANYLSTGYVTYRRNVRGDWNVLWNYGDDINLYDYAKLPTDGDFYSSSAPSDPSGGDVWYQIPHVNYSDLGNGGNTCLFAQEFNAIAVNEYSSMIGDLRQPLGIVLMNFAGVPTVKTSTGIEYSVQGVRLPGLIMMNNFMFPLKTGTTTTRTSSDTSYSKEGNVWD